MVERNGSGPRDAHALESTATLLRLVRNGDSTARERLTRRYLPILTGWARGRLPGHARDLADTDDLVQVTLLRALDRVNGFEPRREGAFLAYLRRILMNEIRDQIRKAHRRPEKQVLPSGLPAPGPSPLERAVGDERLRQYEEALSLLSSKHQEALFLRFELGFTHREVAEALGSPSPNAARMTVVRALARLAEVMDEH